MRKSWLVFIVLAGTIAVSSAAQDRGLSLEDAVSLALRNNPDVLRAQQDVESARSRLVQAAAIPNPDLVLNRLGLDLSSRSGESEINLGVSQLFEFPGKRRLRKVIGRTGVDIALAELDRIRMTAANKVRKAYLRAAYSQKLAAHLRSFLEVMNQYQEMAAVRFKAGDVSSTDVFRGRLETLKIQNEIIEAGRSLKADLTDLHLLTGMDPSVPVILSTDLDHPALTRAVEEWRREAANRPSLRMLQLEVDQAASGVALARKNIYPDLKVGLFYPSLRTSAVGFEIQTSIPLFRQKNEGEVLEAETAGQERRIALESKKRRILLLVDSAYSDATAAGEELALFEKSLLKDAEDMLQTAVGRYRFGQTGALELFDVYKIYKETKLEYLKTLLNYHLALAELEAAGEED